MPHLLDIPVELLLQVISYIPETSSLYSLCLTNRRLNTLSTPLLYRTIHFRTDVESVTAGKGMQTWMAQMPGLRSFSISVLSRPELAGYVRHVSFRDDFKSQDDMDHWEDVRQHSIEYLRTRPVPWDSELEGLSSEDEQVLMFQTMDMICIGGFKIVGPLERELVDAVGRLADDPNEEDEWKRQLSKHGNEDALVAVVIPHLKRLERFDYTLPYSARNWNKMLKRAIRDPQLGFFGGLKSMMVTSLQEYSGANWSKMVPLFRMLSVKEIFMDRFEGDPPSTEKLQRITESLPPKSSNVEVLEIRDSRVGLDGLEILLRAPRKLKSFIYEMYLHEMDTQKVVHERIQRALNTQKDALAELALEVGEAIYPARGSRWSERLYLGGLTKLRRLRLSHLFLEPVNGWNGTTRAYPDGRFPESLEELYIMGGSERTIDAITEGLSIEIATGGLPRLKKLSWLKKFLKISVPTYRSLGALKETAAKSGVAIEVWGTQAIEDGGTPVQRGWGFDGVIEWGPVAKHRNTQPPLARLL
ncbi:hypothetical protein ABW19_dt0204866 [Dactylella cylindrospora]|nr:hypothetical protein ABW19_dt0204866 [Dactylella cylindrospora]